MTLASQLKSVATGVIIETASVSTATALTAAVGTTIVAEPLISHLRERKRLRLPRGAALGVNDDLLRASGAAVKSIIEEMMQAHSDRRRQQLLKAVHAGLPESLVLLLGRSEHGRRPRFHSRTRGLGLRIRGACRRRPADHSACV